MAICWAITTSMLLRHDITYTSRGGDEIYNWPVPRRPSTTSSTVPSPRPACTARSSARSGQTAQGQDLPGLHQRGLRDPQQHPQSECYWGHVNPFGVRSCYVEGKRCAVKPVFLLHRQHRLGSRWPGIFTPTARGCCPTTAGRVQFLVQRCGTTHHGYGKDPTRCFCTWTTRSTRDSSDGFADEFVAR
jgi:UDP-glucuronate decarboxylase